MVWVVGLGVWAILLIAFPKSVGYASLIAACLVGIFFGWILIKDASNTKQYMLEQADKKKVQVSIEYDPNGCPAGMPISLTAINYSSKTVISYTYTAAGYEKGRSSKVYNSSGSSDYIILSGRSSKLCFQVTPDNQISNQRLATTSLSEAIWKIERFSPTFGN